MNISKAIRNILSNRSPRVVGRPATLPLGRARQLFIEPLEARIAPAVFSNPAAITINDNAAATPYPSSIVVSGLGDVLTDVNVTLTGLNHTFTGDIDVLLVGPGGQNLLFMSDVGNNFSAAGVNLTFDDAAAVGLSSAALVSGTFKPTNIADGSGNDTFPAGAPAVSAATTLATFNGSNPNGTWTLFVRDDLGGGFGNFAGGWSLSLASQGNVVVTGTAGNDTLNLFGVNSTTIAYTLNGGPSIDVNNVTSFTFNAAAGNDAMNVNPGGDFLNFPIAFNGEAGSDTLTLNDQANPFADTVLVTSTTVSRTLFGPLTYGTAESLVINAQNIGATVNIDSTAVGVTTTINLNDGNDIINVGNAGIAGGLDNLPGAVVVNGGNGTDAVNVNDQSGDFNDTYTITNTTLTRVAFGGLTYGTIESLTLNAENTLGTNGNNTINIDSTAAGVTTTINANDGDDIINVGNAAIAGGLDNLPGAVVVNGGNGTDAVNVNDQGGNFNDTYTITDTTLTRVVFGGLTYGTIESLTLNAENTLGTNGNNTINIDSTAVGVTTTINANDGNDIINVGNAGIAGGLDNLPGPVVVNGGNGTDTVNVNDQSGDFNDTYTLTNTTLNRIIFGGLTYGTVETFVLNAENALGTNGNNTINVLSTAAGTNYVVIGNSGNDTFNVGEAGTLDGILGNIDFVPDFLGTAGIDTLNIDDSADPDADLAAAIDDAPGGFLVRQTTLTGFAPATISYSYDATSGMSIVTAEVEPNDTIPTAQNVNGGFTINPDPNIGNENGGADATGFPHASIEGTGNGTFDYYSFTISNAGDRAIFDMDFTNFDTELFVYDTAGNLLAGNDDFTGLDSLIDFTFTAAGTYVIGVGKFNSFDGGGGTGIAGSTPGAGDFYTLQISIQNHAAVINNGLNLEFLNVLGAQGGNTIAVNATTATMQTTLDYGIGNDTVTIAGDFLSANNLFLGNTGNDATILNVDADLGASAVFPLLSLQIEGEEVAADSDNRDTLTINDDINFKGTPRDLVFTYLTHTSGDLDITSGPNGGYAVDINVRTMETVTYLSAFGVFADDSITVVGTATDDDITVAPYGSNSALVFLGDEVAGGGWEGPPPRDGFFAALPGVAGGSNGPDLNLIGLDQSSGLTVSGGGFDNQGDELYVDAPSEANVVDPSTTDDIFGFGSGVIIPGFGVGGAFDDITVDDTLVTIFNRSFGFSLLNTNIDTASFIPDPSVDCTLQFNLFVNAGFETNPDANGLADDIFATISNNFGIKINGGDPDPANPATPNLPAFQGDRLAVVTAGGINVYSTKPATPGEPPNVTITSDGTCGLAFSSIENTILTPGIGGQQGQTVNLIGDNNDPTVDQNDQFVVKGSYLVDFFTGLEVSQDFAGPKRRVDVDANLGPIPGAQNEFQPDTDGDNEFFLQINGSAPIGFRNVRFLNAFGDDQNPPPGTPSVGPNDVDTLNLTPYADNSSSSRQWDINVTFDEGNPVGPDADANTADLVIVNGVSGVSENFVVRPTDEGTGQVIVTQGGTGAPIFTLNYTTNTGFIFNGNTGAAGDADTLTLRGTNGVPQLTSGNETVFADFAAAGGALTPMVSFFDGANVQPLYQVLNTNINRITFDLGAGDDRLTVNANGRAVDVDGGTGNDVLSANGSVLPLIPVSSTTVTFRGGDGDDTLTGGAAGDLLYGGAGNDILIGGAGVDSEYGEDGNDRFGDASLTGNGVADDAGNDFMFGGDGIDQFVWEPGDGSDVMQGGVDSADILRFIGSGAADAFVLGANAAAPTHFNITIGAATVDTHGIEQVIVSALAGADTLTLNDIRQTEVNAITIDLGAADASADAVTLNGTSLPDIIAVALSGASVDVSGISALVRINSSEVANDSLTINGNDGNDNIKANAGVEGVIGIVLNGGTGNDILSADATLNGGDGDDILTGGTGNDTLNGGNGDDTLYAGAGSNTIDGGAGSDTIELLGTGNADTISATGPNAALAINLNGVSGTNAVTNVERIHVIALAGGDSVTLSVAIASLVEAGSGNDTVNGTGSSAVLTINGEEGDDSIVGGNANDLISGNAGADSLAGSAGDDVLDGGNGNDSLIGGTGSDTLLGGADSDTFIYNEGDGSDTVEGGTGAGTDGIIINASSSGDNLDIADDNTRVIVTRTNNTAFALNIGDVEEMNLNMGAGGDNLVVGDLTTTDLDIIRVDLGAGDGAADSVTVQGSNAADYVGVNLAKDAPTEVKIGGLRTIVQLSNSAVANDSLTVNGNQGNDNLNDRPEAAALIQITLDGGTGGDRVSGSGTLRGGKGRDILVGRETDDVLEGGPGHDILRGRGGNDILRGGAGNDSLFGGAGNDLLQGDAGDDVLFGNNGDDAIMGGLGYDQLFGNSGNDVLNALDGEFDLVSGGSGFDHATTDLFDDVKGVEA